MEFYYCPADEYESISVIEKSRFICNVKSIASEEEAKEYIRKITKRHSLANHHCYAYIADNKGNIQKFSDDGEPQGTAGMPILNVLKSRFVYQSVAVVTRYFGGIKLGTGGLARAYGGAVCSCLDNAKLLKMYPAVVFEIETDYDGYIKVSSRKYSESFIIIERTFTDSVRLEVAVKAVSELSAVNFEQLIREVTKGCCKICKKTEIFYPFEV